MAYVACALLSLLFITTIIFFFLLRHKNHENNTTPQPPGPRPLPIIGNLHQLHPSPLHLSLGRLSKMHGPDLMSLEFGLRRAIVISSARAARDAFKAHDLELSSRPCLLGFQKFSYGGSDIAFAPYGSSWKEQRKFCMLHLLNPNRVRSFRHVREDEVLRMMVGIRELALRSEAVDVNETVFSLTSSIICRTAFGKRYALDVGRVLMEAQVVMGRLSYEDQFGRAVGRVLDRAMGVRRKLERASGELDEFYEAIIEDHVEKKKRKNKRKEEEVAGLEEEDIVDMLLRESGDESPPSPASWWGVVGRSRDHIKGLLMNIFIGGTETNVATLEWAMTALMKKPSAMKKAQDELRSAINGRNRDNEKPLLVDEDDLDNLPYLKAVVKETLRLHPPAPLLLPRETTQTCVFDGYKVEPGTLVFVNAWAIGRDPECWDDPEDFQPERFLPRGRDGNKSVDFQRQSFELIPFGVGRRRCPGISMGTVTVELALANLLCWFDWEVDDHNNDGGDVLATEAITGTIAHKTVALRLQPKIYKHP